MEYNQDSLRLTEGGREERDLKILPVLLRVTNKPVLHQFPPKKRAKDGIEM